MVAPALTRLNCPQGEFELQRYPSRNREPLRAWCAADVLLLEATKASSVNTLVVPDPSNLISSLTTNIESKVDRDKYQVVLTANYVVIIIKVNKIKQIGL